MGMADRIRRRGVEADEQAQRDVGTTTRALHRQRLDKAAGIGSVTLVCHADAVNFIEDKCWPWSFHRPLNRKDLPRGMTEVALSGPEVLRILEKLAKVAGRVPSLNPFRSAVSKVLADRLYKSIAAVVDQADPDAPPGTPLPTITVDAPAASAEEPT